MSSSERFLFVYGTLLSEAGHPMYEHIARLASLQGRGSVAGTLVDLDAYPGLIPPESDSDRVVGEVYEVHDPDELYLMLDAYERAGGDGALYERVPIAIQRDHGEVVEGTTYRFLKSTEGRARIASGCWLSGRES
jgi:gamma-glutamylcyclotransferase (GGCT)/AIG2-like uncharacterized protein YtfP